MKTTTDKTTRPDTSGAFPREGLFMALDGALADRAVWISAPAGSGKTTLVSGYIESRKLPCLWYQVDERDTDPASFFHHLGAAADAASITPLPPLPVFSPEYMSGIPVFTRRWFDELSKRLKHQHIIVFDECERQGADAMLFDILLYGLDALPPDARIVMISRVAPPPALARLRTQGKMEVVGWDELRLTPEEAEGIARLHDRDARLNGGVRLLHERSQGWVAALVLMLEGAQKGDFDGSVSGRESQQDIFDYLAAELFGKADVSLQDFLLKTSVLKEVASDIANRLMGISHSERILADLAGRNYFTVRRGDTGGGYRYHPLFRDFLLHRAEGSFTPEEMTRLRQRAADLLDDAGRAEEAAELYIEARDWAGLARLVIKEAERMVGQGRLGTLEGWLAKFPADERRKDPWLSYWLGVCRFPFNPAGARDFFKEAFDLFRAADEKTGMFLSWSGAVDTVTFQNEYLLFEPWISVMDDLLANGDTPPQEVEDRVVASMYCVVVFRRPYREDVVEWEKKALALLRRDADINPRFQVGIYLLLYYVWMGRFSEARTTIDLLLRLLENDGGTDLMRISVRNMAGVYGFFTGDCEGTMKLVDDGLTLAEKSGVHLWDGHLYDIKASLYLNQGNMTCAARLLKEISVRLSSVGRFDVAYFHFLSSWYAMLTGDIEGAFRHQSEANELVRATGFTSCESLSALCMAEIMHEKESRHEAEAYLSEAYRIARWVRSLYLEFQCLLAEANIAFGQANETRAFDALNKALQVGREQGYFNTIIWKPAIMSRLCARALEAGIEVDYVKDLIRRRKLVPDMRDVHIENWPWAVRVYTLGRFTLVKDGTAVSASGKAQKKTLDLLKAIIALGGRDVSVAQITDALWADSDGDSASAAFRVALHRLRQMLGEERAIQVHDGRIQLDPRFVWVDVIAFERALAGAGKAGERRGQGEAVRMMEDALKLYKGHFLAQETDKPWAASMQERLKYRFREAVSSVGSHKAGKGEFKKAIECWHGALQVDNVVEEFYQQLMTCYHNDGCRAEAAQVYHRCTKALADVLGIPPSEKTQAIYRRIVE